MGWLVLGSPLRSTLHIQKFMSLSLHLELADCLIHKIGHENESFSSLAPDVAKDVLYNSVCFMFKLYVPIGFFRW